MKKEKNTYAFICWQLQVTVVVVIVYFILALGCCSAGDTSVIHLYTYSVKQFLIEFVFFFSMKKCLTFDDKKKKKKRSGSGCCWHVSICSTHCSDSVVLMLLMVVLMLLTMINISNVKMIAAMCTNMSPCRIWQECVLWKEQEQQQQLHQ